MASRWGKIPAASDLPVEAFVGVVGPDLGPYVLGERQDVGAGGVQVGADLGEPVGDVVQEPVELGVDGWGVGLVVDRVEHGLDRWSQGLGAHGRQVRRVVGTAPLQVAPGRLAATASTRPAWASEVTRRTPQRPRATRSANRPFQAGPVSAVATRRPRTR